MLFSRDCLVVTSTYHLHLSKYHLHPLLGKRTSHVRLSMAKRNHVHLLDSGRTCSYFYTEGRENTASLERISLDEIRDSLYIAVLQVDSSRGVRDIPHLDIESQRSSPRTFFTCSLSSRSNTKVIPPQHVDDDELDLIGRVETAWARPTAMSKDCTLVRSRSKMVLVLLSLDLSHIAVAPRIECI